MCVVGRADQRLGSVAARLRVRASATMPTSSACERRCTRPLGRSAATRVSMAFAFTQRICSPEKPTRFHHKPLLLTKQAKVICSSLAFHLCPNNDLIRVFFFVLWCVWITDVILINTNTTSKISPVRLNKSPIGFCPVYHCRPTDQ